MMPKTMPAMTARAVTSMTESDLMCESVRIQKTRMGALRWLLLFAYAAPALARVGGGQSYSGGGGGSSGGGGGDGGGWLIFQGIRFLFWLTIEYPVIGIPVDIVVIIIVIRWGRS